VPVLVFYDGDCGLCHGAVRFLLPRDADGSRFRFAPLQGATFAALPEATRRGLPDSLVVRTEDGRLLTKSTGFFFLLRLLPGGWRRVGAVGAALPTVLCDLAYDAVAAVRRALFRRPQGLCPVVPAAWRSRFEP